MKKFVCFLVFIVLFLSTQVGIFAYAETELALINAELGEINDRLAATLIVEDEEEDTEEEPQEETEYTDEDLNQDLKKGYQLIADGERLIGLGIGEESEKTSFYSQKDSYYKTRAIMNVSAACDDNWRSVTIGEKTRFFYQKQYDQVLELKAAFMTRIETDNDYQGAVDEFFDEVNKLPDMYYIEWMRDEYVSSCVADMVTLVFDTVNENLIDRGFDVFEEKKSDGDEGFDIWFADILAISYFSEGAEEIKTEFAESKARLISLGHEAEEGDFNAIYEDFEAFLATVPQRTLTKEEGVKTVAFEGAKDSLAILLKEASANGQAYEKAVEAIVNDALAKIEKAESAEEIFEILASAKESISDVTVKDITWVYPLVGAIALFVLSGVGLYIYFRYRRRKKGREKYNRLLEEERERIEKEIRLATLDKDETEEVLPVVENGEEEIGKADPDPSSNVDNTESVAEESTSDSPRSDAEENQSDAVDLGKDG